ncbi:MAG: DinB family protein [Anaerolineaceae bacterium]
MDDTTRKALLQRYRDGYRAVTDALAGITPAELDFRPEADDWTAREVIHHLADSEMTSALRLRRLLAEEKPAIMAYDEDLWRRKLSYNTRPIEGSLDAFRLARLTTAELVDGIAPGDWLRAGTHSESGPYSVETWLEIYSRHAHDHADQIRRARGAKGAS